MTKHVLAYKFRLYPTVRESQALDGQLRAACALYNAGLQERRDAWRMARVRVTFGSQCRQLKEIRAAGDVGLPIFDVAANVLKRADLAFEAFFRRMKAKDGAAGYPRFKPARTYNSLTFPHYGRGGIRLIGNRLRVAGVGSIKTRVHREPKGIIKTATVMRDAGRWYVVLVCQDGGQALPPVSSRVGVDVGLSSFMACSDGSAVDAPRYFRNAAKAFRRAQRKLTRCQRRSQRRRAQRLVVARLHARVRNQRADFQHKLSRDLVNRHQVIAVEDLNIKGLARTKLAKSIHDAGWADFINKLAYKAERAERQLVKVDPRGTSQTCTCGASAPKRLSDRWHDCPSCGLSEARDIVSARIILARAEPAVANTGSVSC